MNAVVDVFTPGAPGQWDPNIGDVGPGQPEIPVITARKARVQHLRVPLESAGSSEWATRRAIRIQIPLQAGDPLIAKGMIVRVVDGGRDASLELFRYTVLSAINSSHAAVRTIEAVTEGAPVDG